ncbi:peroxiredoxin [Desulfosalsimonas propionicica]|uniref:Peroxiredoxin n=1 Tax=Desulfosalsimonas propionicica TaxID=332175 RepID=A0A7W0CBJ4_9BACT|nr:peroxiredoxin [Desulfosalsimonas propionicica]
MASHRKFIEKHDLDDLTLLSDEDGKITGIYNADHWLLPVASRVYIIVNKDGRIVYRKNKGIFLLKNQTETLLQAIDEQL